MRLARTITLKLRYADFETLTRSKTVAATNSERVVIGCVRRLFQNNYDRRRRVRLLGVGLSKLVRRERQLRLPFLSDETPEVSRAIDVVREQFGYDAIHLGMKGGSRW